jgi:hypothetical protein
MRKGITICCRRNQNNTRKSLEKLAFYLWQICGGLVSAFHVRFVFELSFLGALLSCLGSCCSNFGINVQKLTAMRIMQVAFLKEN